MTTRTMWQGSLSIPKTDIPVKLYAAVMDRQIHFHLLHKPDGARVRQRMVEAETGTAVPLDQARKAFQVEPGLYVAITGDELDEVAPEPSRQIKILRFLPVDAIDAQLFERPYYLGPTEESEADYFALAQALAHKHCAGVASWVMRKHSYVGALVVRGGYLMLITLRHNGEPIRVSELDPPKGRPLDQKEKKLAGQLIDALAGRFHPEAYHDDYQERVRELVDAKRAGKKRTSTSSIQSARVCANRMPRMASPARRRGQREPGRTRSARRPRRLRLRRRLRAAARNPARSAPRPTRFRHDATLIRRVALRFSSPWPGWRRPTV